MERYGYICGTDSMGAYENFAMSDGIRDFLEKAGAPYPMEALERIHGLMKGYEQLPGWENQPQRDQAVALRYCPVNLAGKYDLPRDMKPVYALGISGMDVRMGYKKYAYDATVLLDKRDLLSKKGMNYLDCIFGTPLVTTQDAENLRRSGSGVEPSLKPRKVSPYVRKEDLNGVMAVLNGLYSGNAVVIRLEKGYPFNRRAVEILTQVYSMLPPQTAVETGFAAYEDPAQLGKRMDECGVKIFVVPAEMGELKFSARCTLVDLDRVVQPEAGNLNTCIARWAKLEWPDRYETMLKVFSGLGSDLWDEQKYVQLTVKFFRDPFFKFKPVPGKCPTLEALKAEYDRYPALAADIGWLREKFVKAVPVLMGGENLLARQKAEAAALARTADTEEEQKKYTALYRFAMKLDPGDASLHAIVATETAAEERFERRKSQMLAQREEQLRAEEDQKRKDELARQKKTYEDKLSEQEKKHKEALTKAVSEKEKSLTKQMNDRVKAQEDKAKAAEKTAAQNTEKLKADLQKARKDHEAALKKLTDAHSSELQRLKREHEEKVKALNTAHNAEVQKLKVSGSVAAAATAGAQSQNLQKRIDEMTQNHQAELKRLKESHDQQLRQLKDQHARELAARPRAAAVSAPVGSAQEVSQKAKQLLASQLMRDLAEMERLKQAHQAELAALRSGSGS